MALWDNKKYDEEATKIAKAFVAGEKQKGASLTALVEKTARDNGLNPEQIRRLVRVSNIRSWEEKFEGMKTAEAPDRNVEFSLGDENAVIRTLHGEAAAMVSMAIKTGEDVAICDFPDLTDEMADVRQPVPKDSGTYKKGSIEPVDAPRHYDVDALKLEKLAEDIDVKIATARFEWKDAMQGLLDESRKISWTPETAAEFEKSAIALHGVSIVPEINALRKMRGETTLALTNEKAAALRNRIYAQATIATELVKAASVARHDHALLESAKVKATAKLAELISKMGLKKAAG
jgi:hypothetical protein